MTHTRKPRPPTVPIHLSLATAPMDGYTADVLAVAKARGALPDVARAASALLADIMATGAGLQAGTLTLYLAWRIGVEAATLGRREELVPRPPPAEPPASDGRTS